MHLVKFIMTSAIVADQEILANNLYEWLPGMQYCHPESTLHKHMFSTFFLESSAMCSSITTETGHHPLFVPSSVFLAYL